MQVLRKVSIPHRQTNNSFKYSNNAPFPSVSIPHRQTNNGSDRGGPALLSFQFQFLIGRLITGIKKNNWRDSNVFQFLIGRLITELQISKRQGVSFVSIPHRQTNNCSIFWFFLERRLVSIPHRQTNNPVVLFDQNSCLSVSIPHRQTNNLFLFSSTSTSIPGFNSSQVD